MNSEKAKILILAANPVNTPPLQLDEEVRAIDQAVQMSRLRDQLELTSHWAVRVEDIVELLLRHQPMFIHFSGHGSSSNRIILKTSTGDGTEIDERAFADMLQAASKTAKCVFLNACYSELQASLIASYVPVVIGVSGEIIDEASAIFAKTFYLTLGSGETVETAFRLALAEVQMTMPGETHNVHLLGDEKSLNFRLTTTVEKLATPETTTINNSTIKGMIQVNYGDVSMTFNDASQ